jgi:hypothetical protein
MVPGQVISREIITFMRKLDVKEIHGYHAAAGLKLLTPDALANRQKEAGRPDRAAGVRVGIPPGVDVAEWEAGRTPASRKPANQSSSKAKSER